MRTPVTTRDRIYDLEGMLLDPGERRLERQGTTIALTPKAFELLVHLVEHAGKLVEKPALMAALWPGTFVEEGNLAFQVSSLRKALDQDRARSMIETVPSRGYRFVGTVSAVNSSDLQAASRAPGPAIPDRDRAPESRAAVVLAAAFAGIAAVVLLAELYEH